MLIAYCGICVTYSRLGCEPFLVITEREPGREIVLHGNCETTYDCTLVLQLRSICDGQTKGTAQSVCRKRNRKMH